MKKPLIIAMLLASAMPFAVFAQGNKMAKEGKPVPASGNVRSKDGFKAMLLITSDADWQKEWNTPAEHLPHFKESHRVRTGGELHILGFLSNPMLDRNRMAKVSCDFAVIRPDGSYSINQKNVDCFKTKLTTDPKNLYMSKASLKFLSEASDPKGTWRVVIVMRDLNLGAEVTLQDAFVNE